MLLICNLYLNVRLYLSHFILYIIIRTTAIEQKYLTSLAQLC